MKVWIVRHGDAVPGLDDEMRPLSHKGVVEAENVGRFLHKTKELPQVIWHSTLLRARHTAEGIARTAGLGDALVERRGITPDGEPEAVAREIEAEGLDRDIMIVTHQPFAGMLASYLLGRCLGLSMRFTTGTVACFERESTIAPWTLRAHLTAKAIARLV